MFQLSSLSDRYCFVFGVQIGNCTQANLSCIADIQTGKLDSNQACEGGKYPFFTCAPISLRIDSYSFDCDAILLAGNNANGVFHLNRFSGKFNAYQRTYVITVRNNVEVELRFLFYTLRTRTQRLTQYSQGTATKFLTMKILQTLPIPLPPLPEQRRIAAVLGALDDKIELNRRMNQTLETMAQALFKSWFVDFDPVLDNALRAGNPIPADLADKAARRRVVMARPSYAKPAYEGLFPDRFVASELGSIPEGWGAGTLNNLIEVNPRLSLKRGAIIRWLDMKAVPTNTMVPGLPTRRAFSSGSKFQLGDTLLARITPSLENGKTALVDFLNDGEVGAGSTEFLVLRSRGTISEHHVYCIARNDDFREAAIAAMTGSSGRQRVPADAVQRYPSSISPAPVARAFAQTVTPLFSTISTNAFESRTLTALRDTLLPKLISGEVRVPEAAVATTATV